MSSTCKTCGEPRDRGGKLGICLKCFDIERRNRPPKMIECVTCGQLVKHYAKGKCKGCHIAQYVKEHRAQCSENEKARRRRDPDRVRAQDRNRNKSDKRQNWRRKYYQQYYAQHREKFLEYQRNYRRADPERRDNYKRRRMARVLNLPDTLTVAEWQAILVAHNYACHYCGITGVPLEREHKIPASRGGGYTADNIVPACATCNRRKQAKTDEEFRVYLARYGQKGQASEQA